MFAILVRLAVLASPVAASVPADPVARPDTIPLDGGWEFTSGGGRIGTYLGRAALLLQNGRTFRRDLRFQDGTVEYDMAVTRHRSFAYIGFRMRSDEDHEEIYFRPQKSELSDAIQYAPVWHGQSAWQLYHAGRGTAAAPLPGDRWIHVRLVLSGRRAALFLEGAAKPVMQVRMAREPEAGYLSFRGFPNSEYLPPGAVTMAVSNVVVTPGDGGHDFGPDMPDAAPEGTVTRWQLSPAFPVADAPVAAIPDSLLKGKATWPVVGAEAWGLLPIDKYLSRPQRRSGTIVRLVLRSDAARLQLLRLGFSDFATVFVNGRPLFGADAHYSFDDPRQEGVITITQSTAWLPLVRGDNEILIVVVDQFGGWGLMGALEAIAGVTMVSPR